MLPVNRLVIFVFMVVLRRIFDFYLHSSMHVALSGFTLVLMTWHMFVLPMDIYVAVFAFGGILAGYNFVKYDALARKTKLRMGSAIKAIAAISFFALCGAGYCFLQFKFVTQAVAVAFLLLTLLYTLPFFPNRRNARNWAGVKIYIVSLCWVGVTLALPVIEAGIDITADFYVKCIQRFIFIFVLVLVFEIIDLANDDPHLQTVPQQIGVHRTKILGILLMAVFYLLEFLLSHPNREQLVINLIIVLTVITFLAGANMRRSKYYTSFWVELLPIFWWFLLLISQRFFS